MNSTQRRLTAGVGAALSLTLVVGGSMAASAHNDGVLPDSPTDKDSVKVKEDLVDLQPDIGGPLEDAEADLKLTSTFGVAEGEPYATTLAKLKVKDIDESAVGRTFGVHLHVGPCEEGNGAAAGPHYNDEVFSGVPDAQVSPRTEIWLDITATDDGKAESATTVQWIPQPGDRSLVFHADPTADSGASGTRLACVPVEW